MNGQRLDHGAKCTSTSCRTGKQMDRDISYSASGTAKGTIVPSAQCRGMCPSIIAPSLEIGSLVFGPFSFVTINVLDCQLGENCASPLHQFTTRHRPVQHKIISVCSLPAFNNGAARRGETCVGQQVAPVFRRQLSWKLELAVTPPAGKCKVLFPLDHVLRSRQEAKRTGT